jgi:hypothetical protein
MSPDIAPIISNLECYARPFDSAVYKSFCEQKYPTSLFDAMPSPDKRRDRTAWYWAGNGESLIYVQIKDSVTTEES